MARIKMNDGEDFGDIHSHRLGFDIAPKHIKRVEWVSDDCERGLQDLREE